MPDHTAEERIVPGARGPYIAPRLEKLGTWNALTLAQSIPIGPGSFLPDAERVGRVA